MKNIYQRITKKYIRLEPSVPMDEGYAILFTVAVIGIISMITIGLSNAAYKQLILSSVARDSTTAFYQADIASECALYFDNEMDITSRTSGVPYSLCAETTLDFIGNNGTGVYTLSPVSSESSSTNKCFSININKSTSSSVVSTSIDAKGYNICNKTGLRTVERYLKVTY